MIYEDFDFSPIVEELQHHRPLFPANGWRAILGSTNRKGEHVIKELPVMGLVWNSDPEPETCFEFIVWHCGDGVYLSSIKDNKYCAYNLRHGNRSEERRVGK